MVPPLLARGVTVVSYDAAGCGQSEGAYISLGALDQHDVGEVVAHLRRHRSVGGVVVWGHSMGAVTALLHASGPASRAAGAASAAAGGANRGTAANVSDGAVAGVVADSAFTSLVSLAVWLVEEGGFLPVPIPGPIVRWALGFIDRTVQERAGFPLEALEVLCYHRSRCTAVLQRSTEQLRWGGGGGSQSAPTPTPPS